MSNFEPSGQTIALIAVFTVVYLLALARQTIRGRLDFYDLAMLSTVAVFPGLLVFLPQVADLIGQVAGVAFPFVAMFGALFFVVFALLVQELSLLREELERIRSRT